MTRLQRPEDSSRWKRVKGHEDLCVLVQPCCQRRGLPTPFLDTGFQDRGPIHSAVSLGQESVSIDERLWLAPIPSPPPYSCPLLPCRLRGGLPPWCPYRAAMHRGGQEAPAGGWTGEQCSAQGEGEKGFGTPCDSTRCACVSHLLGHLSSSLACWHTLTSLVSYPEADPLFPGHCLPSASGQFRAVAQLS